MRAQVSLEYLIIFAIALAITLPLFVIFISQTNNFQADITQAEIEKAASKMADYSETVYFMGEPAQRTLVVEFPTGINSVNISAYSISFNVTTTDRTYIVSKDTLTNVTGTVGSFSGIHTIIFKAEGNSVVIVDK